MLRFSATGVTHRGLVRGNNEDSAFCGPDLVLVADGVGGGAAGEVASATTTYAVTATAMMRRGEDPVDVLNAAVGEAQRELLAGVRAEPDRAGMATTLTAVLTDGDGFALAHVGDSRGYVWRDGELTRVTNDHTYVALLVDDGRITEAEVVDHPWRNVVLRSVNGHPDEHADVRRLDLRVGDRVLVASDGLTDLVTDDEIAVVLGRYADDPACTALQDLALARGGRDNITVVLGTVHDGPAVRSDGRLLGAVIDPANIVDPTAVRPAHSA